MAEISDDDESDEDVSIALKYNPNSSLNFGMNTAKRMFGTGGSTGSQQSSGGVRHYKKGFKPPPPPGRPAAKVSMPAPVRGAAPQVRSRFYGAATVRSASLLPCPYITPLLLTSLPFLTPLSLIVAAFG